jgi:hypothetical protein
MHEADDVCKSFMLLCAVFLKKTRLYACKGFTIRENDALAVVNLLRSESL